MFPNDGIDIERQRTTKANILFSFPFLLVLLLAGTDFDQPLASVTEGKGTADAKARTCKHVV